MKYEKIFVIGFNKTGTSTLHILFQQNGLTSQHDGSKWDVEEYQCFSDNGNKRDWKKLFNSYPNSMFLLNNRPIDDWIRSRAKHCYVEKLRWGYPPSVNLYKSWIHERNEHYLEVTSFFRRNPEVLTIVDISRSSWLDFVANRLELTSYELKINRGSEVVPLPHLEEVDARLNEAMNGLAIQSAERHSSFLLSALTPQTDATVVHKMSAPVC